MGTWSHEPFGNDGAGDWAYELADTQDLSLIEQALDDVLNTEGYVEAPDAEIAVAAVEVLAKILGRGTQSDAYPEQVDEFVSSISVKPSRELLEKAGRTLERVLEKDSELRELWEESDESTDWINAIKALQSAIHP